jgi:hypothetical protein
MIAFLLVQEPLNKMYEKELERERTGQAAASRPTPGQPINIRTSNTGGKTGFLSQVFSKGAKK